MANTNPVKIVTELASKAADGVERIENGLLSIPDGLINAAAKNTKYKNYNPTVIKAAKGTNPDYFIHIKCPTKNVNIIADLPEQVSIAVASDWENRLASSTLGDFVAAAPSSVGTNAAVQFATEQLWMNTSPIDIPVSLLFDAETNAFNEVHKPMTLLESLTLPTSLGNGILVTPGPTVSNSVSSINGYSGNPVSITIGRQITLSSCIVVSVSNTYDSKLAADGYPISGQSEITIRTPKVLSADEWLAIRGLSDSILK